MLSTRHLEAVVQDLRHGMRILLRARVFTASVLVMLGLSIGSTAAVFTLVEVLLLRPLPVRAPEQLLTIAAPGRDIDLNPSYYSHGFYEHLRASNPLFLNAIASSTAVSSGVNLTDGGVTDRVRGELVSGNYFDVLGVGAAAGRVLMPEDDQTPGAHPVLVLSHAFWQRRFFGSPDVLGRTLSVNGTPFTVVGVARQGFFGTRPGFGPDIWATLMMVQPLTAGALAPQQRNQNYLELMVRLEPDINVRQAQAAAALVYTNWLDEGSAPKASSDHQRPTLQLTPATTGHSLLRGQYSQPLLLLMAAVILLLLIACANVATLLLARATARAREMALRTAIGASRSRLVRQLMTESLGIGVIGGVCGWVVCVYFGRILLTFLPANAEVLQFSPNLQIFAFTSLVSLGSALLFGLAPVLQLGRDNAAAALKSGTGPVQTARRMLESRDVLTVVQVALAILLVMGAGLFARTLQNLKAVDMGFRRDNVLLVSVDPAKSGYTRPRTTPFFDQLIQRVRAHKGIDAVGLASHGSLSGVLPAGTRFISNQMHAAGTTPQLGEDLTVYNNFVSAQIFRIGWHFAIARPRLHRIRSAGKHPGRHHQPGRSAAALWHRRPCRQAHRPRKTGSGRYRSRRSRGECEIHERARSAAPYRVFSVPWRKSDDLARQGVWGSSIGLARHRTGVTRFGRDAAALPGADHRGTRRRCAAPGAPTGDAFDDPKRGRHPHSDSRTIRSDQFLCCSTNP